MDAIAGSNYMLISTSQMMSVPYALYAKNSAIDSMAILNLINSSNGSGGCDYAFPEGLNGYGINEKLIAGNSYTVPNNKRLYITNMFNQGLGITINGIHTNYSASFSLPIVANSGDIITQYSSNNPLEFNGLIVDAVSDISAVNQKLIAGNSYTVPNNKRLYITNMFNQGLGITINGIHTNYSASFSLPIVANAGDIITQYSSNNPLEFNGYLADEDYFANCGGGAGSSNSNNSVNVSTFGDTLTINGQSIIVPGISNQNIVPTFGSVTDIEGNVYSTVNIGGKEWMTEDLKVTKFNNGDDINQITGSNIWSSNACTNPGYIENSGVIFYNGFVIDDSRNVCPVGWSVPTTIDYENILNIFNEGDSSHNNSGNAYGKQWSNSGKALKSLNISPGGYYWSNASNNNFSYLDFFKHNSASCNNTNANAPSNSQNYWTKTSAPYNQPSKWCLRLQNGDDLVTFYDQTFYNNSQFTTRCVKD